MNLIIKAAQFAANAHKGVTRKWGNDPYIFHPGRVASRVMIHPEGTEEMACAAFLHDTVEDSGVKEEELDTKFGHEVAKLVMELTNPSKGSSKSRAERKQMDRDHIATISHEAKIIKLLDRIDNIRESVGAPADFAALYKSETSLLLKSLEGTDLALENELRGLIEH